MEQVAWGFGLPEAPTVDRDGALYVSDVVGGGVHRIDPEGTRTEVIAKRRGVGGLVLHADGGLILTGRDLLHVRDGTSRVVLPLPPEGSGFNDLTAASDGSVLVGLLRYHPMDGRRRDRLPERDDPAYITAAGNTSDPARQGTVFRTPADVPGLPVPPARV